MAEKRQRGFAAMDPEKQRQIASMGGRAAHERGTAHEWDSREAAEAGRKGGKAAHRSTAQRANNPGVDADAPGGGPGRPAGSMNPEPALDATRRGGETDHASARFTSRNVGGTGMSNAAASQSPDNAAISDARREISRQGTLQQGQGTTRPESQWDENEYENRRADGSDVAANTLATSIRGSGEGRTGQSPRPM